MTLGDKIRSSNDDQLTNFILQMLVRGSRLALKCSGYGIDIQNRWIKNSLIDRRSSIYNRITNEIPEDGYDHLFN